MLLLSTCLFVITIFSQIFQQAIPPSMIRIALFCFLTSTWQLSYRRLFYMMISNTQICALTEYYALYLAPVPLFTYLAEMKRKKSLQMIYYGIAVAYFLIFCGINFADMKYHVHLIRIESLMYILFFISACVVIGIELFGGGQLNEPRNLILRAGLLMFLAFNLLQIILLVVTESLENSRVIGILQRVDLSSLGIVIFMISVITAVSQTAIRMVRQNAADAQLRVLAVTDELTGIPNRRYCEMRLHELRSMANYGIVFLDVDGLKKANDMYGHDMGDKLIRKVAEIMRESFSFEEGFFGRWGGDEFLVVCAEAHEAELFAENLEILQEEVNRKGEFPFPVSISYGIAYNDPRSARKAEEVRREADRKMYERKKQRPQRRSF
jgi:diguanylate cyclase (GGDEF)-like protein